MQASAPRWIAGLATLLLIAWFGWRWSDTPIDPRTGVAAVTDPDSAWRLRRTALAASTSRLPQVDGFGSFPESIGCVDLPVFDELLAASARLSMGSSLSPAPGVIDEVRLSRFAAYVGPLFTVAWFLLLFGTLRRALGNTAWASACALLVVASAPLVVEAGRPGTLWIELFAASLLVVQLRVLLAVGRATQVLDRFTWAMVAGGVTGVGLATTPLFYLPLLATWFAFLYAAAGAQGEQRRDLVRAGLLFWLPGVVIGLVPSLGGPWVPATAGPVAGWTELLGDVALLGAAPLVLLLWTPRGDKDSTWSPSLTVVISLALALALLPAIAFGPGHEKGAALLAALGQDATWPVFSIGFFGGPMLMGCVLLLCSWFSRTRGADSDLWATVPALALELIGFLALAGALLEPRLLFFLALPAADALARWLEGGTRWKAAVLLPLAFLWGGFDPAGGARVQNRAEGLATMEAARWLREQGEAPGPWSNVRGGEDWSVFCDDRLAPLVAWHGRRPCAAPGPRRNGDAAGLARWRRSLPSASEAELLQRMGFEGVRYVLLSPSSRSRLVRTGAVPETLEALSAFPVAWSEVPGGASSGVVLHRIMGD